MNIQKISLSLLLFLVLGVATNAHADKSKGRFDHVLLISVDGLHATDVENYIVAHPNSNFAALASNGVRFTEASTSKPSDSFPGLLSMVTGGLPKTTGVFYDVSYDRLQFAPTDTTCTGTPGNVTTYDETIDLFIGGVDQNSIDPTLLPNTLNKNGQCVRVFPHDFLKVNTIFEVVKKNEGTTAWADKHPAYDIVNGPSGKGVDDLYTPEITVVGGLDATVSVVCTGANDNLKVTAILNEIDGFNHDRTVQVGPPTLFGMNFQSVSVGQKVTKDNSDGSCKLSDPGVYGMSGGYLDAAGTPTVVLDYSLKTVDTALGAMMQELQSQGIFESTLMIVTAKHGQAPIDPSLVMKPGHLQDLVAALPDAGANPAAAAIASAAVSDDDVALIWLLDQSQADTVADCLRANQTALFIREVISGESLARKFGDPLKNSRTPDVIVLPNLGTIYTTSTKKLAEHGGFSKDDTNVGLIVSAPRFSEKVIKKPVQTIQIAPTILEALGFNPRSLRAVRTERVSTLPVFGR